MTCRSTNLLSPAGGLSYEEPVEWVALNKTGGVLSINFASVATVQTLRRRLTDRDEVRK
jgi:hypothetical protein